MSKTIVIKISASDWTSDQVDSFTDWLTDELTIGNMGSGDDAEIVSVEVE